MSAQPTADQRRTRHPPRQPDGWMPDGNPLHGQVGVLAVDDETGHVQCAACGRWLRTIGGAHLTKRHEMTVEQYRERYGLALRTVLESADRRAQRSASTYQRIEREPKLREMLERGAAAARSGALTVHSRAAIRDTRKRNAQRPERQRMLRELGRRGNEQNRIDFLQRVNERSVELGFPDLAGYLTDRHGNGWSVARVSSELGCAREPLNRLLADLALPKPLDPAHPVEVAALARVGHATLAGYLHAHPPGGSPTRLAAALGHSGPWLQLRARRDGLDHLLKVGPGAEERATSTARQAGFPDLPSYLRHRYEHDRAGSRELHAETGIHPQRVSALLDQAGVLRRTDPAYTEQQALDHAGWKGTLATYATNRTAAGWTIQRMSWELGRSDVWLARRLRSHGLDTLIGPPGRPKE